MLGQSVVENAVYSIWLSLFAALVLASPGAFAFISDRQAASFQREAFGHYRRAARNLRILVWIVFVFYALVIAGAFVTGDIREMMFFPLSARATFVYLRIVAVLAGYVVVNLVTHELWLVTRPAPPGSPAS